jgi:seryl-tRNA synthetase
MEDLEGFHEGLVARGLIIPGGAPGAFGRGAVFEDVLEHANALITREIAPDRAEVCTFPPVIDRTILERAEYLDAFPQLSGVVYSFTGPEREARELSARVHEGRAYADLLGMTGVALNPAACYPLYPTMKGTLPAGGRLVTMLNWVYRHEPSPEPTRMQAFRVREMVRAGPPDAVLAWRDEWRDRGLALIRSLGLPATCDVASDPFFGRAGRMLAASQKDLRLKFEVLVPILSAERPTAVCSFNYHQDHFAAPFGIHTDGGAVAHTACLGFGLERLTMALFRVHGFDPEAWPRAVRERLWP